MERNIFQTFHDNKSICEMGTIEERVGIMIYIIKGPQFTRKRHIKQIRKRLSNDADSVPPEEKEVIDVTYSAFYMPIPQASLEQRSFKRKMKMTDFNIVKLKRKRYWVSWGVVMVIYPRMHEVSHL